jgi:phage recombination protein Bet
MEGKMANELVVSKENRMVAQSSEFTDEQVRLLGDTVAKGCSQNELALFLHVARLKKLDPFTGQIHVVKRWDSSEGREKMTIQTGIDGYRVIAARTNELAGIDDAVYDSEDGEHPNWAKVTVYRYGRKDERVPYTATARWGEYVQTVRDKQTGEFRPNRMWKTMPFLMLGKVAEALALRKAFPDELGGVYTNDEMAQADSDDGIRTVTEKRKQVQQPQRASEKPASVPVESAKPATAQQPPVYKEISGAIEKAKLSKNGALWILVKGEPFMICVEEKNIDGDMKVGNYIGLRGLLKRSDKLVTEQNPQGSFWSLVSLLELSNPVQDEVIEDAEFTETEVPGNGVPDKTSPDVASLAEDLFGRGNGMEAEKPMQTNTKSGTLGVKREKILYMIASKNVHKTGFTEDNIHRVLASMPIPLEHLRDLESSMYEYFEKLCTGEKDWRELLGELQSNTEGVI